MTIMDQGQNAAQGLGIHPPHRVRIVVDGDHDGHDWPNEMIAVHPDRIVVHNPTHGDRLVTYPFVASQQQADGSWRFTGTEHDFTVTPGPAEPVSSNGHDDWPYDES